MIDTYTIGLAVAGWLATTWMAYRWGLHSQKLQREHAAKNAADGRKRAFLVYLTQWQAEVRERIPTSDGLYRTQDHSIWVYEAKRAAFRGEIERVRGDFKDSERFSTLADRIANLNRVNWRAERADKVILAAMEELINFVNAK